MRRIKTKVRVFKHTEDLSQEEFDPVFLKASNYEECLQTLGDDRETLAHELLDSAVICTRLAMTKDNDKTPYYEKPSKGIRKKVNVRTLTAEELELASKLLREGKSPDQIAKGFDVHPFAIWCLKMKTVDPKVINPQRQPIKYG